MVFNVHDGMFSSLETSIENQYIPDLANILPLFTLITFFWL
jgi:hypothetical protein